jgi:D-alanyl-D-alanine dipeptidase
MKLLNIILFMAVCCGGFAQNASDGLVDEAEYLRGEGLVNVRTIDSTIVVRLLYADTANFVKRQIYRNLREAFLQKEAAMKLVAAQQYLKRQHPSYTLIIYDAARPQTAQRIMWEHVKNTPMQSYVASPSKVSMHSYGVAVDLSILNGEGNELDMGTPVDFLGALAEPRREQQYLAEGKLTQQQIANRQLLRAVMRKAGFRGISNEWWHYEAFSRPEASAKYKRL